MMYSRFSLVHFRGVFIKNTASEVSEAVFITYHPQDFRVNRRYICLFIVIRNTQDHSNGNIHKNRKNDQNNHLPSPPI